MMNVRRLIGVVDTGIWWLALILILAPVLWMALAATGADADTWDQVWYRPFYMAVGNSAKVLTGVLLIVFPLGLLLGTLAGLYEFPLKIPAILFSAIPLLFPSFLISIGIQSLQVYLPFADRIWVDGFRAAYGQEW